MRIYIPQLVQPEGGVTGGGAAAAVVANHQRSHLYYCLPQGRKDRKGEKESEIIEELTGTPRRANRPAMEAPPTPSPSPRRAWTMSPKPPHDDFHKPNYTAHIDAQIPLVQNVRGTGRPDRKITKALPLPHRRPHHTSRRKEKECSFVE